MHSQQNSYLHNLDFGYFVKFIDFCVFFFLPACDVVASFIFEDVYFTFRAFNDLLSNFEPNKSLFICLITAFPGVHQVHALATYINFAGLAAPYIFVLHGLVFFHDLPAMFLNTHLQPKLNSNVSIVEFLICLVQVLDV